MFFFRINVFEKQYFNVLKDQYKGLNHFIILLFYYFMDDIDHFIAVQLFRP